MSAYTKRERKQRTGQKTAGSLKYSLTAPLFYDGGGDPREAREIKLVAERYQTKKMAEESPDLYGFKLAVFGYPTQGGWQGTRVTSFLNILSAPFTKCSAELNDFADRVEPFESADPQEIWEAAHAEAKKAMEKASATPEPTKPKRRTRVVAKS